MDFKAAAIAATLSLAIAVVVVISSFGAQSAVAGPDIHLCFAIDGSASISGPDFITEKQGVGNAIKDSDLLPQDGTVEVTVVLFSTSATTVVEPTVITNNQSAKDVGNAVIAVAQPGGFTNIAAAINLCTSKITDPSAGLVEINITTDGLPNVPGGDDAAKLAAFIARDDAADAGVHFLDSEIVGNEGQQFMLELAYPQPAEKATRTVT